MSVIQYVFPEAATSKDTSITHKGLVCFPSLDNESAGLLSRTIEAPSLATAIESIKVYCIKDHASALNLTFSLTIVDTSSASAPSSSAIAAATYSLSGNTNDVTPLTVPSTLYSSISLGTGDIVGLSIQRNAPDSYASDLRIVMIEFTFTTSTSTTSSHLSSQYTAIKVWIEAVRDLDAQTLQTFPHWEKYRIVNRAQEAVVTQFADLMQSAYLTSHTATMSGDTFSIDGLNIMRTGQNVRCSVTSSGASYIEALTLERFLRWRTSAPQNRSKMVWAITGNTVQMKKSSTASYGTVVFWYPRTPTPLTADSDYLDVPDGPPIELVILKVKDILKERVGIPKVEKPQETQEIIERLYRTFGMEYQLGQNKDKSTALR
jgi:hypothetical protein